VGVSWVFAEAFFAKKGVAALTNGMGGLFFGAVEKGENFSGFPRASSSICFHAFKGGKLCGGIFPTLYGLGSLGGSWFLIPGGKELGGFSFLSGEVVLKGLLLVAIVDD